MLTLGDNPISRANIERLFKTNPETAAEDDPAVKEKNTSPEFQKQVADGMLKLLHGTIRELPLPLLTVDFTQYWPKDNETNGVQGFGAGGALL